MKRKRYILIRKIIKGVIVLLFIALLLTPIAEIVIEIEADCYVEHNGGATTGFSVYERISYYLWGNNFIEGWFGKHLILHPLYWVALILCWIGFIFSFGNIKRSYKNKIINRNIGNISGLLILLGIIGMCASAIGSNIGFTEPSINIYYWSRRYTTPGANLSILIIILILSENIFLNRIKITVEEKQVKILNIQEKIIPTKLYCRECGNEILDKTKMFCPMCGKEQK